MRHAREDALREDLYSMRNAIDQFIQDLKRCPGSFEDLVSAGYMRALPTDPFTKSNTTWQPVPDDSIPGFSNSPCVVDVHSGSKDTGTDGTHYDQW